MGELGPLFDSFRSSNSVNKNHGCPGFFDAIHYCSGLQVLSFTISFHLLSTITSSSVGTRANGGLVPLPSAVEGLPRLAVCSLLLLLPAGFRIPFERRP